MPIYTRSGDAGQTGLFGNQRVAKTDPRVEAYGAVDELNAVLGLVRAEGVRTDHDQGLARIQSTLFDIGADLATPGGTASVQRVATGIAELEQWIDRDDSALPALRTFVLPGGQRSAALLHVARTVCRRAERRVWALAGLVEIPAVIGTYLNRLSDLLFVWARSANHDAGVSDVPWRPAGRDSTNPG